MATSQQLDPDKKALKTRHAHRALLQWEMASHQSHKYGRDSKYVGRSAPRYDPQRHTAWTHEMRHYLRDNHPLGFQIIEGDIVLLDKLQDLSLEEAESSLALTRSTSYTLLPTSSEDWLSGLREGAPSSSESSEDSGESTDSTAETVPIARGTDPTRARSGASTTPSKAAKGAAGESNKKTPGSADSSGKADEDASAGDAGQPPATPDKRRRSKRLSGEEPSPDASEARAEGAGENETGDTGMPSGDGTTTGTAAAARTRNSRTSARALPRTKTST